MSINIQIVDEHRPSRMQLTLEKLVKAHHQPHYFYNWRLPAGYITIGHVTNERWGGAAAGRNIRRLRDKDHGLNIILKYWNKTMYGDPMLVDGRKVGTWIYSLATPIDRIDFFRCCLKNMV